MKSYLWHKVCSFYIEGAKMQVNRRVWRVVLGVCLCVLGSMDGLVRAQENTQIQPFWKSNPSSLSSSQEAKFLPELNNFFYASSHGTGQSFESRISLGTDFLYSLSDHIDIAAKGDLWWAFPKTSSGWLGLQSAYVGWHSIYKHSIASFKVGRILPDWGGPDEYSPIKQLFPKFAIDPLQTSANGVVGFLTSVQQDLLDIELILSPLFVPNLGGPIYDTNDKGKFYSPSRWALPLYYTATVGTAPVPLNYKLHIPKVSDVIFKAGWMIRMTLKDFFDQYKLSGIMVNTYDPRPRIKIDGLLNIPQNSAVEGNVDVYPKFYRQFAYGLEGKVQNSFVDLSLESLYRIPDNPEGIREDLAQSQEWKNAFFIQTKEKLWLPPVQVLLGFSSTKQFHPYIDPNFKIPSPSLHNFIGKISWKPIPKLSLFSASEVAFSLDQGLWKNGLLWVPISQINVSMGLDSIIGKDDTYWGQFRDNDRIWLRGAYAF